MNVSAYNSSNIKTKTESIHIKSTNGVWQNYWVDIVAPNNTKKIVVEFGFNNSHGTYYVDTMQLEENGTISEHNYIENGGFRESLEGWQNKQFSEPIDVKINGLEEKALPLNGNTDGGDTQYQIVTINGKKGEFFTIGGWLKGFFVKSTTSNPIINNLINDSHNNDKIFNFTNDRLAKIEVGYNWKWRKRV